MPIKIHGKDYSTVAERVHKFRHDPMFKDWFIQTEIIHHDEDRVLFHATVGRYTTDEYATPLILGSGYAEERRNASAINRTSACEVGETSAIGRALASIGLSGSGEYASANEVQNAIEKQATDSNDGVEPADWRIPTGKYANEKASWIVEADPKYALRCAVQHKSAEVKRVFSALTKDLKISEEAKGA